MIFGCFFKTVYHEMRTSQNGFGSYQLSIHKKTNIIQNTTKQKNIHYFYTSVVKQDHLMTNFVQLFIHHFVIQPLQNPLLCIAALIFVNDKRRQTHRPHSESIVINDFYAKKAYRGLSRQRERAKQLLAQLTAFTLVTDKSCRLPVSFIGQTTIPIYLATGLWSPLFCSHYIEYRSRGSDFMAKLAAATHQYWVYQRYSKRGQVC